MGGPRIDELLSKLTPRWTQRGRLSVDPRPRQGPPMERDQRVRIVGGVGAAVSFARRRRLEIREERRRTMGPLWAADRVEPKPPRAGSSSKTEFAISPEEREVTTMNVCTAGGSQGNAAPPYAENGRRDSIRIRRSLPPSDIKETCLLIVKKDGGRRNSN